MSVFVRSLAALLSRREPGRQLAVLTYHRVLPAPDDLRPSEPDATLFGAQMSVLAGSFNVLRLDAAVEAWQTGRLPSRAIAITFDDGYRDNHDVALPILTRLKLPATFFVATGFLGSHSMFNDVLIEAVRRTTKATVVVPAISAEPLPLTDVVEKRATIARLLTEFKRLPVERRLQSAWDIAHQLDFHQDPQLMMRPDDVGALSKAGMEIGAHTVNHPILAALEAHDVTREIEDSRRTLEAILGRPVVGFAYPNGRPTEDYRPADVQSVRSAGFGYAVSTRYATCSSRTALFELPRVAPWGRSNLEIAVRVARGYWLH